MLKKILIVLAALVVLGTLFGEDDTIESVADDAAAEAAELSDAPAPTQKPAEEPGEQDAEGVGQENDVEAEDDVAAVDQVEEPAPAAKKPEPRVRTFLVVRAVDGDTIELANGDHVRVLGIDTPERGECGYDKAAVKMARMVVGKRVRLTSAGEDRDRYDRLLRYVDVGKRDAGLAQINAGRAIARYDSRDGYGYHPRENKYIAADKATPNKTCPKPKPKPQPVAPQPAAPSAYYANCTAAREAGAAPVRRGDPGYGTHLDRDGDGIGCE